MPCLCTTTKCDKQTTICCWRLFSRILGVSNAYIIIQIRLLVHPTRRHCKTTNAWITLVGRYVKTTVALSSSCIRLGPRSNNTMPCLHHLSQQHCCWQKFWIIVVLLHNASPRIANRRPSILLVMSFKPCDDCHRHFRRSFQNLWRTSSLCRFIGKVCVFTNHMTTAVL